MNHYFSYKELHLLTWVSSFWLWNILIQTYFCICTIQTSTFGDRTKEQLRRLTIFPLGDTNVLEGSSSLVHGTLGFCFIGMGQMSLRTIAKVLSMSVAEIIKYKRHPVIPIMWWTGCCLVLTRGSGESVWYSRWNRNVLLTKLSNF